MDPRLSGTELMARWKINLQTLRACILEDGLPVYSEHFQRLQFETGTDFERTWKEPYTTRLSERRPDLFPQPYNTITVRYTDRNMFFKLSDIEKFETEHGLMRKNDNPPEANRKDSKRSQAYSQLKKDIREIAKHKWEKDDATIEDMAEWLMQHEVVKRFKKEHSRYSVSKDKIKDYIRDLAPSHSPGRRSIS